MYTYIARTLELPKNYMIQFRQSFTSKKEIIREIANGGSLVHHIGTGISTYYTTVYYVITMYYHYYNNCHYHYYYYYCYYCRLHIPTDGS